MSINKSNKNTIGSKNDKEKLDFYKQNIQSKNNNGCYHTLSQQMTKSQLLKSTILTHNLNCLCDDCTCGRHLCQFKTHKNTLNFNTTYRNHYPPKYSLYQKASRPTSAYVSKSPLLTQSTTYLDTHKQINGDKLERPKPNNNISCQQAPSPLLTSYKQEYPGHRGKNQHVPVNPEQFRGGLEFNQSSTYSKHYGHNWGHSAEKAKPADQFRMSGSWLGQSSYRNQYKNPKDHIKPQKKSRKQSETSFKENQSRLIQSRTSNPQSHFKTTYNNSFSAPKTTTCKALEIILAKQAQTNLAKSTFRYNSDFKVIDGNYSSLAKHIN